MNRFKELYEKSKEQIKDEEKVLNFDLKKREKQREIQAVYDKYQQLIDENQLKINKMNNIDNYDVEKLIEYELENEKAGDIMEKIYNKYSDLFDESIK